MKRSGLKFAVFILFSFAFALLAAVSVSAASAGNDLHLNIQTTYSNGSIETGTFSFVFNISSSSDCNVSNVVYSKTASLTTDSRGIISYYLTDVNLDYTQQYWLCYYRDGTLESSDELARTPYTFQAQNITLAGVAVDSNLNLSSYNISQANYGFFSYLGSLLNKIGNLFATNATIGSLNVTNLTVSNFNYGGSVANVDAAGSEGAVQFNSAGGLGGNSSLFFINSSTGRIGIGTSSPQNTLNVVGGGNFTGALYANGSRIDNLNSTGLIKDWNASRYIKNWNATGLIINWSSSTNLANYFTKSDILGFGYYNSTSLQNVSQLANDAGYYNSTTLPTGLTWAEVTNGTLYLSSNPYGFYNSTTLPAFGTLSGSGNSGYLAKFNGTSSINNSAIYQNGSNIGIGTTTPLSPLSVGGSGDSNYEIYANGPNYGVYVSAGDTGVYSGGNNYGVYGFSSGTGIYGTGAVGVSGVGTYGVRGSGTYGIYGTGTYGVYVNSSSYGYYVDGSGYDIYANTTGGKSYFAGKVGIGTTSPATLLDVRDSTGSYLTLGKTSSFAAGQRSGIIIQEGSTQDANITWNADTNALNFYNNVGTHTILSMKGGNVGIGTTNPQNTLNVVGDANVTGNLYANGALVGSGNLSGSGTTGYVAQFTGSGSIGDSAISDDGSTITINLG